MCSPRGVHEEVSLIVVTQGAVPHGDSITGVTHGVPPTGVPQGSSPMRDPGRELRHSGSHKESSLRGPHMGESQCGTPLCGIQGPYPNRLPHGPTRRFP